MKKPEVAFSPISNRIILIFLALQEVWKMLCLFILALLICADVCQTGSHR